MNDSLVFLSSSFLSFLLACRRALKLKHRNIRGRESDSFGDDDISLCEEAVAYAVWVSLKLLSIHVVGMLLPLNSSCSNLSFLMSRISAALTKNPLSYQLGGVSAASFSNQDGEELDNTLALQLRLLVSFMPLTGCDSLSVSQENGFSGEGVINTTTKVALEALLTSFTLSSSSSSSFSSFSASVGGCLFFGSVTHTGSSSMDSCRFFGSVKDTGSASALTTPNLYELLCRIFSSGCLVTSDIISVSMHQTSLQSSSEFPSVSLPTRSSSAQPSSGEGKITKEKELPLEHQIELQFLLCELGIGL
ncbi:hypothetical protein HID58_071129 [Brassica napus]|nr:hypothetical protein HID58_071129 [Brassica napus]CAF2058417.1 unnamed protein product [Brassica napus]